MKHTILFLLLPLFAASQSTSKVQDFILIDNHWQRSGPVYNAPDTITLIHRYKWKREKIVAIQDYKRVAGKWVKYGAEYPKPDSVRRVRAFVR